MNLQIFRDYVNDYDFAMMLKKDSLMVRPIVKDAKDPALTQIPPFIITAADLTDQETMETLIKDKLRAVDAVVIEAEDYATQLERVKKETKLRQDEADKKRKKRDDLIKKGDKYLEDKKYNEALKCYQDANIIKSDKELVEKIANVKGIGGVQETMF